MAITLQQRNEIVGLIVTMFKAAPGVEVLADVVGAREAGSSINSIAENLATKAQFQQVYPSFLTAQEFADQVVGYLIPPGMSATDVAWCKDWVIERVNDGESRSDILVEAAQAIVATTNPAFAAAQALMNNRVDVANYYTVEKIQPTTTLPDLQAVLENVTADPASVTTAKAAIDGGIGQPFTLTTGSDSFTGGAGSDTFTAGVVMLGDGSLVNTLQDIDSLHGGAGTDVLNVTLGATKVSNAVKPLLNSIEIVNLTAAGNGVDLDLIASTGVTNVNVTGSTFGAILSNIGNAAVGVANQNEGVEINGSTATTLALNLDNVDTNATSKVIDLGTNAATSFAITAKNAHVTFDETGTGAATTSASVAATGANDITFVAADLASLKTLTVTGAGSVDFGGSLSALTTVTVGDGGVTLTSTNATANALTVTTGAGVDTLSVNGASVKSLSTGAGNDTVTLKTSDLGATATINLGAGDDTLTFDGTKFAAGATISGGDGTDTIGFTKLAYTDISKYGVADFYIDLVGVTSINAAAFEIH